MRVYVLAWHSLLAGHELRSLARLEDSGAMEEGVFLPLGTQASPHPFLERRE